MLEYYYILLIFPTFLIEFSKSYKVLTLEDPTLCSPIVKRRIKLGTDAQSGLIVTMNSLKDHSLDWDKNFFCKFQVDVPKNSKIFAVIQRLAFRQNTETNECIDYLHFKRTDGTISKKFCGNVTAVVDMDVKYPSVGLKIATNSFDDYTGQLDVNIHIAKDALRFNEFMEFEVAFTSYRSCSASSIDDENCGDNEYYNCIYKGFIKDTYINCPYINCVDEDGCGDKPIVDDRKKSVGNKVIISTVSVLFIAFLVFICFIYLCRKYQKLCWSEQFSNTNIRSQRPEAVIEMSQTALPEQASTTNALTAQSAEEDKDLPPSYASLFPNR